MYAVKTTWQLALLRPTPAGSVRVSRDPATATALWCPALTWWWTVSGLSGIIDIDLKSKRAWIWAGTPIYALGNTLNQAGLALHNQGDIDRQLLAGAIGTGTHGTGRTLRNLSSAVTGLHLTTPDGESQHLHPGNQPEVFEAARLGLGALGIITRIELQLCERYRLRESLRSVGIDELVAEFDQLAATHRHAEFFWYPSRDQAQLKVIDTVEAAAMYPLAQEGSRCGWSHEVLPNHRPHRHTEMEYSVPAAAGMECFLRLRELLKTQFPDVQWPVEYRTLAADDLWLSTAHDRETVTISVHQTTDEDETAYYKACERLFAEYEGRPHWGKLHYLNGNDLSALYANYQRWWQVRDGVDPASTMLNDHLEALRPNGR